MPLAFSDQEIVRNCFSGGLLGSILSLGFGGGLLGGGLLGGDFGLGFGESIFGVGDGLCLCCGLLSGGFCFFLNDSPLGGF